MRRRSASVLGIAVMLSLDVLAGFGAISFASDLTSLAETKSLTQRAANVGALAGARELPDIDRAQTAAAAFSNLSFGSRAFVFATRGAPDILVGHWSPQTRTLDPGARKTNAVRVALAGGELRDPSPISQALRLVGVLDLGVEATAVALRSYCARQRQQAGSRDCAAGSRSTAKLVRPTQEGTSIEAQVAIAAIAAP